MKLVFAIVANSLNQIAKKFGITYNEINIIVYYLLIPLSWAIMVDFIIKLPIFTPLTIIVWTAIIIVKRNCFREWCDAFFVQSQKFLLWFRRIGWNYIVSSVIICVIVPLLIYATLILLLVG